MIRKTLIPLLVFCCASTGFAQSPATNVIAFVHANVIPMDVERVLADQTVIVANGRITALGPSASIKVPRAAVRIDARGKYLMPALCDMHVHLLGAAWQIMLPEKGRLPAQDLPQDRYLFPFVANGVTTVMSLSATADELELRRRIAAGELIAPRLILAPMIDGPGKAWPPPISTWVATPEEARNAVIHAKSDGYDKIKVYSFLTKDQYDTIMSTAKDQNIGVVGHIPMSVTPEYVVAAGQQMIAHTEELAKHAGGDFSAQHIDYYVNLLKSHGTWLEPTLVTTRSIIQVFDSLEALLARPEAEYWREPLAQTVWTFISQNLYKPIPKEYQESIRDAYWKFQRPLTKAMHDKGGRLLAGTDVPLPGLVPGFALHRELKELVDVGFTPYEALRTSTTAPFEFLGERDRRGTIAVGQESDLVLVDANPLTDIAAAGKISGVLMRGRWLGSDAILERMQALMH